MGSVMLTSGRTCTPTLFCQVAPPCTQVLLTECRRRSLPWLPPPSRSRSLLLLRGSTLYGSVAPSWPLSQLSSRCGSPSRSMMNPDPKLFTESASKCLLADILLGCFQSLFCGFLANILYKLLHYIKH